MGGGAAVDPGETGAGVRTRVGAAAPAGVGLGSEDAGGGCGVAVGLGVGLGSEGAGGGCGVAVGLGVGGATRGVGDGAGVGAGLAAASFGGSVEAMALASSGWKRT